MNEYLLPAIFLFSARRERQRRLADNLLPAFIPGGTPMQRTAITVVSADQQVRQAERAEVRSAREAVTAVQQAAASPTGVLEDAHLNSLPTLRDAIRRAPELRQQIDQISVGQLLQQEAIAEQLAAEAGQLAIQALAQDPANPLTKAQIQALAPNLTTIFVDVGYFDPGDNFRLP